MRFLDGAWRLITERSGTRFIAIALVLTLSGPAAWGAACNSNGTAPQNWSNTLTWSCGAIPGAGDDVTISNGHVVTVDGVARQAGSLVIATGATATSLTLATNLTVTNASGRAGTVTMNATTAAVTKRIVVGANTLAVTGNVTINGGTTTASVNNVSQLTVTSGAITIGGNLNINSGTVSSSARVTLTPAGGVGSVTVTGSTTVTGGAAANRIALLTVAGASNSGQGIILNGTLSVGTLTTVAGSATVSMTGAAGGRIKVAGNVTNGDTITVGAGIFDANGATFTTTNAAATSTTTVAASGQLNIAGNAIVTGGSTASSAASIAGTAGAIAITGTAAVTGGSFNPSGATLSVTTGTLTITGNATVSGGSALTSVGTMSVTSGTITIGTVPSPKTLTINAGTATGTTTVSVSTGLITVTGDTTLTGGGSTTQDALLTVTGASAAGKGIDIGGNLQVIATFTTSSTVSMTSTGRINVAGSVANGDTITVGTGIFNANGASFTVTNASVPSSVTVATPGQLNIAGNAIVTGGGTASSAASIAGSTGSISIGGDATVTGGSFNPSGATLSVTTGTMTITGNATVSGGSALTSVGTMSVTSGTITIGTVPLPKTLAINAGSAAGTTTVSVTSGIITVNGETTVTGGAAVGRNALLTVTLAPAVGGNGINITGDLTVASHAVTPTATTATVSSTALNSVINVAGNVTNGDRITINTGIFSATGAGKTFTTTNNSIVTATAVTSGTLAITGNSVVTGGTANPSGATMSLTTGILTVGGNLGITPGTVNNTDATVSVTSGRITVTGNATLTGGDAAGVNRDALLTVAGASAVGNGINVNGTLNILPHGVTPTATTATVSMTGVAGGRVTVAGDVNNGDTVLADAGIFTVTGTSSTYANSNATIVANTRVTTGSLTLSGDAATLNNAANDTMSITSTGSITVGNIATNTGILTNSGTITVSAAGTVNANGNFTNTAVTGTFTNTLAGQLFLGGATSTIDGTFNRGTGTVTMDGIAAQSLAGSALNFYNFTVNNTAALASRTVTLGNDLTINNQLTFTSGRIVTGSQKVILPSTALAVSGATGSPNEMFVAGNLQKFAAAGAPTVTFEIGTDGAAAPALGYSPVTLVFVGVGAGGGSLIGSVGLPLAEHPSIASSGVDAANSVNRWWSFTTTGVTGTALPAFTSYTATATFLNPSDLDSPASTGSYEIERWDTGASTWNTTTVGTRTGTSTQATGITALGQLAIGVKALPPATGDLNAFETSTAGGAVTGRVYTKLVSTDFSLDVVAIVSGAQHATFNKTVQVDLVTGAGGGLNCPGTPVTIAGTTQSVALTNGRGTTGVFNVASAFPDARVRIQFPVSSPTTTSCSTDNFSNRPTTLTVTSANATQTDSSGSPAIKTGASFNLTATAVAGYTGTPAVDNTAGMVVGTPNAGAIGGTFSAASGGIASGAAFTYSQVGNFGLSTNAVYDSSFTTVDQAGGDCVASSFSNTLASGKYGCSFGSTAVPLNVAPSGSGGTGFGRFIPDNFIVSYTATPEFAASCGTFSYVGAAFLYGTAPQITVTARNGAALGNATTTNYAGSYMKLTNGSLTPATQALRYSRFDAGSTPALDATALPAVAGDPAIGIFTNGVGTLTFDTGAGGLKFARSTTTPSAPFSADIALSLNVIDADGVAFAGNPAMFGTAAATLGIAFASGNNAMRYGRLRLPNALGSEKLDLPIAAEVQYWTGTGFSTNTLDSCTSLSVANFSFPAYAGGITSTNMNNANISPAVTVPFTAGASSLKLTKPLPTPVAPGSTTLTVNLSAESKTYLQGNWGVTSYTANPGSRAAFGVYGSQPRNFIFFRENY
jgi:hypothetical protein